MDKRKFKELMDKWAAQEMKAAPEISPTEEVNRKFLAKQKRDRFGFFTWPVRLAAAGLAAALIILVIVLQPPKQIEPVIGLRKGIVEAKAHNEKRERMKQILEETGEKEKVLGVEEERTTKEAAKPERPKDAVAGAEEARKIEGAEKEERMEQKEPPERVKMQTAKTKVIERVEKPKEAEREVHEEADKKAAVKALGVMAKSEVRERKAGEPLESKEKLIQATPAAPSFVEWMAPERIEFQYQPKGAESVYGLDIEASRDEVISLTAEDNYRLLVELPQERYLYVFQVSANRRFIQLFPNAEYNPAQNPIRAGETIIVPLPPNWLYMEKGGGEVQIYVASSAEPLQAWDITYAEYSRSETTEEKDKIAAGLLDQINKLKQSPKDQVSIRVFKLYIH